MGPALTAYSSIQRITQGSEQPASATIPTAAAAIALADAAARLIVLGEKPAPFCSPRDGRALRLVPPIHRLARQELEAALTRVIQKRLDVRLEAQMQLHAARSNDNKDNKGKGADRTILSRSNECQTGPQRGAANLPVLPVRVASRALLAWFRGWAYLEAGVTVQAFKDARAAVAYTAVATSRSCAVGGEVAPNAAVITSDNGDEAAGSGDEAVSWWPSAQLLLAEVQMAVRAAPEQVVLSLLRAQNALSGPAAPSAPPPPGLAATDPGTWVEVAAADGQEAAQMLLRRALDAEARTALEVAMRRLPEDSWEAFHDGGEMGLLQLLARRVEERMPEFLRRRPRWYYYNAWMRQRLDAVCPGLPEPVTAKLLADTDANDLDLMLQHPLAIMAQAEEYTQVLELYGEQALLSYKAAPLAWEEMQAMAAGGLVGLPIGYDAAKHAPQYYCPETSKLGSGAGFGACRSLTNGTTKATIRPSPDAITAASTSLTIHANVASEAEAAEGEDGRQGSLLHHNPLVGPGAELAARRCLRLAMEALQMQAGEGQQWRLGTVETFSEAKSRRPLILREARGDDLGGSGADGHSVPDSDIGGRCGADARTTICMGQLDGRSGNCRSRGHGVFGGDGGASPQTNGGGVCGTVNRVELGPNAMPVVRRQDLVLLAARIATGTARPSSGVYGLSGCEVGVLGGSMSGGTALGEGEKAKGLRADPVVQTAAQPSESTEDWKQTALPAGTPAPADLLLFELD